MSAFPGDLIDSAIDLMMREKFSQSQNGEVRLDPGEVEIRKLVIKLKSANEEETKKAAWSLANLARSSHNRRMILSEGALPLLISYLKDKTDVRKIHVLSILTDLSQTAAHRKEIMATESLTSVLNFLKSCKTSLVEQMVEFIANMCLNRNAKQFLIREKSSLEILMNVIKKSNEQAKSHVFHALVLLSPDPEVTTELLRLNCVRIFVDTLLTSEDWILKASVAEVITHLSKDPKNLGQFGSTSVWQLLELLVSDSLKECKLWALQALSHLSHKDSLRKLVLRHGGIPVITNLVKHSDEDCVLAAVKCLANLTKDTDKVTLCAKKGVIKVLVELMERKKNSDALTTIANISEVNEQRLMLLQTGVVPHLVNFLKTKDPIHQIDTLRCLAHISDVDISISWFLDMSVISSVVSSLRSSCLLSCSHAARIIRNISESNQGVRLIVESDAIWLLVRLLRSQSKTAVLSAAQALSILSSNRNARALIHQFDGVTDLMRLMKQGSDETKVHAVKALYDLSSCTEVQRYIACEGGIPTLIGMLSSRNFQVRENALCLLVRLGLAKEHWLAIRDGGGVGPLLKQLVVSEVKDAVGVCQSFVKFFNAVIVTIIKGRITSAQ